MPRFLPGNSLLIFGNFEPSTSPLIRPKIVALVQGQNVALWGGGPLDSHSLL